ncbi:conserved hypothetical protein [Aster yellows witches'-broom phytoplasma AYWB]|uniref:Signal peptidase I n=2 Tax=Candidatus Phytoplasma TaxID=33926 RepID=Q2NIR9_AYWBP|nr:conserved hypothetical protein [Aster yellows witches'-broom phytoplasma AYWB]
MFKNKTKIQPQSQKTKYFFLIFKKSMIIILDFFLIYLFIASLGNVFFPAYSAKYLGIAHFPVASGSMEPFIHGPGDEVFIIGVWDASKLMPVGGKQITKNPITKPYKVGINNPKDGDIVIFEHPHYNNPNVSEEERQDAKEKRFIIHRVVSNDPNKKLIGTWGDANEPQLPYEKEIPYDKIVGKYIFKHRYIFSFIRNLFDYIRSFFVFLFQRPLYLFLIIVYLMIMAYLLYALMKELKAAK